jgi:hypothetical protein
MLVILTFARFANIFLGNHGRRAAVTVYTRHHGKETLE